MIFLDNMKKIDNGLTNGGSVYLKDSIIYKFFSDKPYFLEEKLRNVLFLSQEKLFHPFIMNPIYDNGEFIGYTEEYIQNAFSWKEAIYYDLPKEFQFKIICDVYEKLKILHCHNYYYGDIHMCNLLFNNNDGFLIDLDEIRLMGEDEFKFSEYYNVHLTNTSPYLKKSSLYLDNVKMMVSSLSLLLNYDFEVFLQNNSLEELKKILSYFLDYDGFLQSICYLIDAKEENIYFDDILVQYQDNVKLKI